MTLKEEKHKLTNELSHSIELIDESIAIHEKETLKHMEQIEAYKEKRQSKLALLNKMRKIKHKKTH